MAKYRLIFDKFTGSLTGCLTKEEMSIFKKQRIMDHYHIVKMTEEEVAEAFDYYDISDYSAIFIYDILLFSHEEIGFYDDLYNKLGVNFYYLEDTTSLILDTFKFTSEEESIVKIAFQTALIKYERLLNHDCNIEDEMDLRRLVIDYLKYYGLRWDIE